MINLLLFTIAFSWMDIEYHEDIGLKPLFNSKVSLTEEFSQANEVYFNGDLVAAKQKYVLIALRAYDANWDFNHRKMIAYSLLKLCQLERALCEEYISSLVYLDADQIKSLDSNVFEPPLIEQALLMRNKLETSFYSWQPGKEFEDVKYFIINGRIYNHSEGLTISLPLAKQRIVLVYANYQTELYVGEVREFLKWNPKGPIVKKTEDAKNITNLVTKAESFEDVPSTNLWWENNKKNVLMWSIAGGIVAYFISKNNKSSNDGGSVSSSSKE